MTFLERGSRDGITGDRTVTRHVALDDELATTTAEDPAAILFTSGGTNILSKYVETVSSPHLLFFWS